METKRREIGPRKENRISHSQTATTKLRGIPNQPTKTYVSSSSQKQIPSYLRPTSRSMAADVSKQQGKKPAASVDTSHKPTIARTTPTPTQIKSIPTNASLRSSTFSGRTVDSRKPVPGKSLKTPSKDAGKPRLLQAAKSSIVKKSSTGIKKKEIGSGSSARKERITFIPSEKVENPSLSGLLKDKAQGQDQESYTAEGGEKRDQVDGKGADDLALEDQEPLDVAKTEAEIDSKTLISEFSEHEATPLDVKRRDSEDKSASTQVLEKHSMNETDRYNKGETLGDNSHEDAIEEEVKEVDEVAKEQETAFSKRDDMDEYKEVVVENKQESENQAPKQIQIRTHGKKDAALSNDVIEETASKLREQRKNKVKALAGAFETVISLQEK